MGTLRSCLSNSRPQTQVGAEQKGVRVLSPMLPADGALVPGREETYLGRGRWPSSSVCMLPFGPGLFLHLWVQDFTQAPLSSSGTVGKAGVGAS